MSPRRVTLTRRAVPVEQRLVYSQVVEGLLQHGLHGRVTHRLKQRLKQAGLDVDRPLMPAYPVEIWERCVGLAAKAIHPDQPEEVAWRLLGERHIDGYRETMLGRAMFGVLGLLGPKRRLSRTRQNFRAGNNYQEVIITDLGPTEVDVWLNERGMLRYFKHGIMLGSVRGVGEPNTKVVLRHFDDEGVTIRVSWGDPTP